MSDVTSYELAPGLRQFNVRRDCPHCHQGLVATAVIYSPPEVEVTENEIAAPLGFQIVMRQGETVVAVHQHACAGFGFPSFDRLPRPYYMSEDGEFWPDAHRWYPDESDYDSDDDWSATDEDYDWDDD